MFIRIIIIQEYENYIIVYMIFKSHCYKVQKHVNRIKVLFKSLEIHFFF